MQQHGYVSQYITETRSQMPNNPFIMSPIYTFLEQVKLNSIINSKI